ncbi:MAG: hypothetical protein KAT04_04705 [Methylococcales bacterium]|nr:hypothetical protein [Methylococcales bacterium]
MSSNLCRFVEGIKRAGTGMMNARPSNLTGINRERCASYRQHTLCYHLNFTTLRTEALNV